MKLVVMQPSYLPWLGYFDLLLQSDKFLVYDNVQFDKDGWRNRNKIKTPQGAQWLTVPVLSKGLNKPLNSEIKTNMADNWQRKHMKSLEMNYSKAPFAKEILSLIAPIYDKPWELLIDLDLELIRVICGYLEISTPIERVSDLDLNLPKGKNEKLIHICKSVQADEFYEPKGGEGYIDSEAFRQQGVQLTYQQFEHPSYPQLHGEFVSHLSIVDLLFNCGMESIKYLKQQQGTRP